MIYSTANLGGAELYAVNLLRELQDEVDFTVVSPEGSFLSAVARQLGHQTIEAPITYPDFDSNALLNVAYMLSTNVDGERFDLIYVHHLPAAMVGHMLSMMWRVPLLLNIDSPFLREPYQQFIAMTACYVVSASRSGYDRVQQLNLSVPERLFVVQPGVDLHQFVSSGTMSSRNGSYTIGVAARLVADKGVDKAIRAVHDLIPFIDVRLLIAGAGDQAAQLHAIVTELGLEDRVHFLGQLSPGNMADFYRRLDVFVLPTVREGCPITVLEAAAMGVPIVATAVGDIPYVVQTGKNGYTITEPEPEALAYHIRRIIEQHDFPAHAREYNRTFISEFGHTKQAYRMLDVYRTILRRNGRNAHG